MIPSILGGKLLGIYWVTIVIEIIKWNNIFQFFIEIKKEKEKIKNIALD